MSERKGISSPQRMARVLYAVMQSGGEWFTLSSLSRKTGIPVSTLFRYFAVLVEETMLEQNEESLQYRLTRKMTNLLTAQGLRLAHMPGKEQAT